MDVRPGCKMACCLLPGGGIQTFLETTIEFMRLGVENRKRRDSAGSTLDVPRLLLRGNADSRYWQRNDGAPLVEGGSGLVRASAESSPECSGETSACKGATAFVIEPLGCAYVSLLRPDETGPARRLATNRCH